MTGEIKNLEQILLPKYLGKNKRIAQCDIRRLTALGENYGSMIMAVDIKIKDKDTNNEETLHAVAKLVPPSEFVQKMFKSHLTFKKELEFYRTIIPTLQEFQRKQGMMPVMDFFPEFYGGRNGLDHTSDRFDKDAVILLENLATSGYFCAERTEGFDLESAKYILNDLAILHAVPMAIKLKDPELFEKKIKPYINNVTPFDAVSEEAIDAMIEETLLVARDNPECVPYLESIRKRMLRAQKNQVSLLTPREPHATLIHCDFWVNNTMLKVEGKKIIGNKIVDFQTTDYGSPAKDMVFFIFNSVQNHIVTEHYEDLVKFYHKRFTDTLQKLYVDLRPFSLEAFQEEIDYVMDQGVIFQSFVMLRPMFANRDSVKELQDMSESDLMQKMDYSRSYKEKCWMLVKEFARRKWLVPQDI